MLLRSLSHAVDDRWLKPGRHMRVLLVQATGVHATRAMFVQNDVHSEGSEGIGYKPPMSIMYLGGMLLARSAHEVKLIDAQAQELTNEQVLAEAERFAPDVIGITAWTDFWYDTWQLTQALKETMPETPVVLGGPHVCIYPEVTLANSGADAVVLGDGEDPMLWIVNALSHGLRPSNMPGVHFKEHGVRSQDKFYIAKELDELPFPARRLLPYKIYRSVISKSDFITTMITSRGCPYKCTFCKLNFQKTLCRSAEDVVSEMAEIHRMGIRDIEVYDDTFSWSKQRVIDTCKGIIDQGLDLRWAVRDRVSNVNKETLDWMYRAGCRRIHFGVESGSDKTLKTVKKAITTEQARTAVRLAKDAGFEVLTYFMIGLPGETREDALETVNFALELDADYATFSVTVPYAGTEMYEQGLKDGLIPEDHWLEFSKRPTPDYVVPYFFEQHLNKQQLLELRDYATNKFYFRPKYIFHQLRHLSSMRELAMKSKLALGIAKHTLLKRSSAIYTQTIRKVYVNDVYDNRF